MIASLSRRGLMVVAFAGLAAGAVLLGRGVPAAGAGKATPDREAVERARTTVLMLDDLYKGYVVHITDTYVRAREIKPAASVTKKVFKHMEAKGWHTGRLVDATGEPVNRANLPRTDFEKRAVEKMKQGKDYFDEVGDKDGKPVLRAATRVPVVMKACSACHAGKKEGDLLGTIVYEVPIR
jgi:hypothetical protein